MRIRPAVITSKKGRIHGRIEMVISVAATNSAESKESLISTTRLHRCGALVALLAIAGCATTTNVKLPDPAQQSSVIEYVTDLRLASSTLGDAVMVRALPTGASDYPEFRWWWKTWCP